MCEILPTKHPSFSANGDSFAARTEELSLPAQGLYPPVRGTRTKRCPQAAPPAAEPWEHRLLRALPTPLPGEGSGGTVRSFVLTLLFLSTSPASAQLPRLIKLS